MGIIIPKLRESAKGQSCTFVLPGICNGNPETSVLCHCRIGLPGMGTKPDDWFAAIGCHACHEAIDGHRLSPYEEARAWLRAIQRTQRLWYDGGLMTFPQAAKRPVSIPKIVPRPEHFRR